MLDPLKIRNALYCAWWILSQGDARGFSITASYGSDKPHRLTWPSYSWRELRRMRKECRALNRMREQQAT